MKYIITIGYEYYEINNYIKHCIIIDVRNARKNVINIELNIKQFVEQFIYKKLQHLSVNFISIIPIFYYTEKKSIYLRKNRKWIILTNFKL